MAAWHLGVLAGMRPFYCAGAAHRLPQLDCPWACAHESELSSAPLCGRWLVSGGMDGVAAAWDLDAMACTRTFAALDQPVASLSISADARHVAYGGGQELVPIEAMTPGAPRAGGSQI